PEDEECDADVCAPRLATPPLGDPPPQPARSAPVSRSAAAAQAARRSPVVTVLRSSRGAALSGMSSPPQLVCTAVAAACTPCAVSGTYRCGARWRYRAETPRAQPP